MLIICQQSTYFIFQASWKLTLLTFFKTCIETNCVWEKSDKKILSHKHNKTILIGLNITDCNNTSNIFFRMLTRDSYPEWDGVQATPPGNGGLWDGLHGRGPEPRVQRIHTGEHHASDNALLCPSQNVLLHSFCVDWIKPPWAHVHLFLSLILDFLFLYFLSCVVSTDTITQIKFIFAIWEPPLPTLWWNQCCLKEETGVITNWTRVGFRKPRSGVQTALGTRSFSPEMHQVVSLLFGWMLPDLGWHTLSLWHQRLARQETGLVS